MNARPRPVPSQDLLRLPLVIDYGRMVVLDDRVLVFANPEDAAEYLGFDLQRVD